MPELPDITIYCEALERFVGGSAVKDVRVASPFVVRTFDPAIGEMVGRQLLSISRLGKRLVLSLEGELHLVIHLMVAGRLRRKAPGTKVPRRHGLLALDFPGHTILLTEASKKKRASVHLVSGSEALAEHDPGGIDPLHATPVVFRQALTRENHTLKRALTDPRLFSGIGNAYSDEILHEAQLSPVRWTSRLSEEEMKHLREATLAVLTRATERLRGEVGDGFPEKVTAFREDMAVHGRYGQPCPRCRTPVQRIVRAENEVNYCPACQTKGKLLSDRALSRLLRGDWPKTLEALEELKRARKA